MNKTVGTNMSPRQISEPEINAAQQAWADGIIAIGQAFIDNGDYKKRAIEHVKELYAHEHGGVLFKPTFACEQQFRITFDDTLSYFIGGHIQEDTGFAIKPWANVRFGEQHIIIHAASATAMGNYYFTEVGQLAENKVEYTFGYIKDAADKLRINLHHSSIPFCPN